MSHVTRTPFSRSKGQRSRSPCRFTHRGLNASGGCSGKCGNVFGVGNYCYVAVCSEARRGLGAHGEGEGLGHIVAAARLVTSAEKIIFSSAFFCLFVRRIAQKLHPMFIQFGGTRPRKKRLDFGSNPDLDPAPGISEGILHRQLPTKTNRTLFWCM